MTSFLLSAGIVSLVYFVFYAISAWTYSFTLPVPESDVTSWAGWGMVQRDGIEIYVAFVMMLIIMGAAIWTFDLFSRLGDGRVRRATLAVLACFAVFYFYTIGFFPSGASVKIDLWTALVLALICTVAFILGHGWVQKRWASIGVVIMLCLPSLFAPVWLPSRGDYCFILAPAWRVLNGETIHSTIFQYDHFYSLLGFLWLKLSLPFEKFFIVSNVAYAGLFIGAFFLARSFFKDKGLAVYFALSLMLIKLYGPEYDVTTCIQGGPLRLDWWLPLLALVLWKGVRHWSVGLALGGLVFLHHSFGVIYSMCFVLLTVFLLACERQYKEPWSFKSIQGFIINFTFIVAGWLSYVAWLSPHVSTANIYRKYSFAFLPIDRHSFFWYVPIIFAMAVILLWFARRKMELRVFETGTCLVFLAIGNLIYFFGRSHEQNLIAIASSLWMLFFWLIDMYAARMRERGSWLGSRWLMSAVGVFITGLVVYFYSGILPGRLQAQMLNAPKFFKTDDTKAFRTVLNVIKNATGGSSKVLFLSTVDDFKAHYYGGYKQPDPYGVTEAHIFVKPYEDFLNEKLSEGYYLVVPGNEVEKFLPMIS